MTLLSKTLLFGVGALTLSVCSIFGKSVVEIAPYVVLQTDGQIEIRRYEKLVLVSKPMDGDVDKIRGAFNKLFRYFSGEKYGHSEN